jgi:hypothetical protein
MTMIRETLVVSRGATGEAHIAPMGAQAVRLADGAAGILLQPFRPSTTLDNLLGRRCATLNHVDDVRIFAGCLTGRREWPTVPADRVNCVRLKAALVHVELEVAAVEEDAQRPRILLRRVHEMSHAPFPGFNRAKAAVLEAAILVSRLNMLSWDKVEREIEYLRIAIDKTAGDEEREAWGWLLAAIDARRREGAQ